MGSRVADTIGPASDADELQPKSPVPCTVALRPVGAMPTVSIIVPSFNQGRFLRSTLDSILSQDHRPIEVHVIDGGSRDETLAVLESYGDRPELRWTSERDRGVVHAVNKGFARVRGDIVAIQSSDDCYLPDALRVVVAAFQADPSMGLVYGDTAVIDAEGQELRRTRIGPYSLEGLLLLRTWIPQPSAFFRRELLDAVGGWDDAIPYAPDTDLWLRMAFRTSVRKLDRCLSQRRIHDAQRDRQAAQIVRDFGLMIDRSADIAGAPRRLRRAARASKHLIRQRYAAGLSDWGIAWHLVRAAMICPTARNPRGVAHHLWLPVRKALSRTKRRFFGARPA